MTKSIKPNDMPSQPVLKTGIDVGVIQVIFITKTQRRENTGHSPGDCHTPFFLNYLPYPLKIIRCNAIAVIRFKCVLCDEN